MQKTMVALMKDKTIIMIAHRFQSVQKTDQILMLNGGKIVIP